MEEEKAEKEELAQQQKQLEKAQQFAQKRKSRQGSSSPQKVDKEPEEVQFNENLGQSAKSIKFGNMAVNEVLEESADGK